MRAISPKRARLLRQRRALVERVEPQVCDRCHLEPAVDIHELQRRSQNSASMITVGLMWPIGRTCHSWITTNPIGAIEEGWAIWSWQTLPAAYVSPLDVARQLGNTP